MIATLLALFLVNGAVGEPQRLSDTERVARMMAFQSAMQGRALQAALAKAAAYPLGSEDNPVRAEGPSGQHAYLDRLRCADGGAPSYQRQGSLGDGVYDNIVDLYQLRCTGDAEPRNVVIDMYHKGHVENQPVPGFTVAAP